MDKTLPDPNTTSPISEPFHSSVLSIIYIGRQWHEEHHQRPSYVDVDTIVYLLHLSPQVLAINLISVYTIGFLTLYTWSSQYQTHSGKDFVLRWFNSLADLLQVGAKEESQGSQDEQHKPEEERQVHITAEKREKSTARGVHNKKHFPHINRTMPPQ